MNDAHKNDQDKDPWHLAPWDAFRAIVHILKSGAEKYEPRNWEKGMAWSRCYSALMRHMTAWWEGEDLDIETGDSHLWHAGCCLVFLIAYELRGTGIDDRPALAMLPALIDPPFTEELANRVVTDAYTRFSSTMSLEHPPWLMVGAFNPPGVITERWYNTVSDSGLEALNPWVEYDINNIDRPPPALNGFYTYAQHEGAIGWLLQIHECPPNIRSQYWKSYARELNAKEHSELMTWERGLYEWIEANSHFRLKSTAKAWNVEE